jgi:hypothetical protein
VKRRIYTKTYKDEVLKGLGDEHSIMTAEEHSYASDKEFGENFHNKETLLRWYLSQNADRLAALGFLIAHIYRNGFLNVLSLGAGPCVMEYLLRYSLPVNANVVALDYNSFFIQNAKKLFDNIKAINFDFFKDDIVDLNDRLNIKFDIAVFYGSAYVMDDLQFVDLLKKLKEIGVKQIIDFHAGYLIWKAIITDLLEPLRKIAAVRKLLGRPPLPDHIGKFHGYSRSRGELRRLYKEAGLSLVKETSAGDYLYVAILA